MPLISVIIPTFNGSKYIIETVNSVLEQSLSDFEIIIVDDGSTDNTLELIENISSKLIIIKQENKGIAEARNEGIRNASGKFISFLDHDDVCHPDKLSAQIECFNKDAEIGVVYGDFIRWNSIKSDKDAFFKSNLNSLLIDRELSGWIYHKLLLTNWVLFSSALFRADVVRDIGWFNCDLPPSDDWDYVIRVNQKYKFYRMKQPVVLYRVHENQTSRKVSLVNTNVEFRKKVIKKYGLVGNHGETISNKELRIRFSKNYFDFGYEHYCCGEIKIAVNSFYNAIKYNPYFLKSYAFWVLSVIGLLLKK